MYVFWCNNRELRGAGTVQVESGAKSPIQKSKKSKELQQTFLKSPKSPEKVQKFQKKIQKVLFDGDSTVGAGRSLA
jgi:hypothetical protein